MLVLVAVLGFFAISVAARCEVPAAQDELCWLGGIDSLYHVGVEWDVYNPGERVAYSPHLYLRAMQISYALFGPNLFAARTVGLMAGLLTLGMVAALTARLVGGNAHRRRGYGALAALACSALPIFVQGSAIIDIDNTILMPLLLGMLWASLRMFEKPTTGRAVQLALITALALWGRITTPLVLFPILTVVAQFQSQKACRLRVPVALLGGVATFLATWSGYGALTGAPFEGPFLYTWAALGDRTVEGSSRLGLVQLAGNTIHLALWVGIPAAVVLGLLVLRRGFEWMRDRGSYPSDLLLACGLAILCGYTVVGGTPFGFPKYHCPAIPMLVVALAVGFGRFVRAHPRISPAWTATLGASALVQVVMVGDPLHVLRVTLRETQAVADLDVRGVALSVATAVALALVAWSLLVALQKIVGRSGTAWPALIAVAVGSGLGMVATQNETPASTGYSYGVEGTRDVAALLQKRLADGGACVAPSEVLYLVEAPRSEFVPNELWTDVAGLSTQLADPANVAYVLSISTNTVAQVQIGLSEPIIEEVLDRDYVPRRVGEYRVWLRRDRETR